MKITKSEFGKTSAGELVTLFHLENNSGAYVEILDFGARIHKLAVPDRDGILRDICLSVANIADYEADKAYYGAICGRVANRICEGRFSLNGTDYQLAVNNGPNHLHGGNIGYSHKVWKSAVKDDKLVLTMVSFDGEENYPGNLTLTVTYSWSEDNEIGILYEACTDKDTLLNVTNHAYFNLNGEGNTTILNHELFIDADAITPVNENLIPTGELLPVAGTPFDFKTLRTIGKFMDSDHPAFAACGTYDHNFVVNGMGLREAAILQSKESGIRVTCFTDQPGIQIYVAANPSDFTGKYGDFYPAQASVCLETQHYPDSIHHENFPSIVLKAGESFRSKTLYHFSNFQ